MTECDLHNVKDQTQIKGTPQILSLQLLGDKPAILAHFLMKPASTVLA